MSIVEFKGGPITVRYLERKRKSELARMYMDLLKEFERLQRHLEGVRTENAALAADLRNLRSKMG